MTLQKTPFPIDFIGNDPEFVIRTAPNRVEGRRYRRVFEVASLTAGRFIVSTAHGNTVFQVRATASDDNPLELKTAATAALALEQLEAKLVRHRSLAAHYSITAGLQSGVVVVVFEACEPLTGDYVNISSTGSAGDVSASQSGFRSGLSQSQKERYGVIVAFETASGRRTPEFRFDDNNGTVRIGTAVIAAYMGTPAVPRSDLAFGAYACPELMMGARMLYCETSDDGDGVVHSSGYFSFLNAEINQADRDDNRPDWTASCGDKLWRMTDIDIYGQDNDDTIHTDVSTDHYLYVSNFTASSITRTATVAVTGTDATATATRSLTFPSMSVCRIPAGWGPVSTLFTGAGVGTPLAYTLSVATASGAIRRTFVMRRRHHDSVTLLLQNRCRLYEGRTFRYLEKSVETEGDKTVTSTGEKYLLTSRSVLYMVRTGPVSQRHAGLLMEAFQRPDNLMVEGRYAWKVSIVPGSISFTDTEKDLVEVEFSFLRFGRTDRMAAILSEDGSGIAERETIIDMAR